MAKFNIPVTWEASGFVKVEADTLEEAYLKFEENKDSISLPSGEYVDDSFRACYTYQEHKELRDSGIEF